MNEATPTYTTNPADAVSRDAARAIVIERGADYLAGLLDASGVEMFSTLPVATLARIVARDAPGG